MGLHGNDERPELRLRRRVGKEWRERLLAGLVLVLLAPVFLACALAIKLEGWLRRDARGPVFFRETRVSRGREFELIKFRTLSRTALAGLGPGPTHIKFLEHGDKMTRVGAVLKQWYLDELPQLWNIVRGDMFLIGTRPWPIELYEQDLAQGRTVKRDMPAGLIGPVQAHKGDEDAGPGLDEQYWEAFLTYPGWRLFLMDLRIILRSLKVQLRHEGL